MLLPTDILVDVIAFLNVETIFASAGLNTASRLLSQQIARHHPALRHQFARGPRSCEDWHIENLGSVEGRWCVRVWSLCDDDGETAVKPLPLEPASQDILAAGNICLLDYFYRRSALEVL
jgi:hypothetical protein